MLSGKSRWAYVELVFKFLCLSLALHSAQMSSLLTVNESTSYIVKIIASCYIHRFAVQIHTTRTDYFSKSCIARVSEPWTPPWISVSRNTQSYLQIFKRCVNKFVLLPSWVINLKKNQKSKFHVSNPFFALNSRVNETYSVP